VPIIIIPIGTPNVKEAVDNAIEQNKCAVGLADVVVDQTVFIFLVVGFASLEVEGNLIIDREKDGCSEYHAGSDKPVKKYIESRTYS